jgi:AraC family transcriptional regulator of adaptative response/methylated-DNA-[protein]-cysteine methyltransferase
MRTGTQIAVYTIDEDGMWEAIERRDAHLDGQFFFAVHSTRIYCRPSCPSRRPRRDRVAFYKTAAAAEFDGYRACKRCRPAEFATNAEIVQRACQLIGNTDDERFSLSDVCAQLGIGDSQLHRAFKLILGLTPRQYAAARRLEKFKHFVREGASVVDSIYEAGYGSSSRLYENAAVRLGMTPAVYRSGGQGVKIVYAVAESPLGRLLIAATERGLCSVAFGDDDSQLYDALEREFPAAEIIRNDTAMKDWVTAVTARIEGRGGSGDLPLDVRATAFQHRVWGELRRIPFGETRSYADLAEAIGRPRAVRAVARACASNPVAVVNPCHRIVRSDGELGGYRWGVERKRKLLETEKRR